MRHHNTNKKFGRERDQREAFIASLAEAVILREKVLTTEARAKAIRPVVESMITKAKKPTLATRRDLISRLKGRAKVVKKLIDVIGPRYTDRTGGYLRITKVVTRSQDGRKSAVIELV